MPRTLTIAGMLVALPLLVVSLDRSSFSAERRKSARPTTLAAETPYYATSPQEGQAPDGNFAAGTAVTVVRRGAAYTLVRSADGIRAFVATRAIKTTGATRMSTKPASGVVLSDNRFAFDLYGRLRTGSGNLFFSPASISMALAMTYAGAAGSTETEMAKTLHFGMPQSQVHDEMHALLTSWQGADENRGYTLDVANRLWGQAGYQFLPDFLKITRTDYGAELGPLDFKGQPEEARQTINAWIEEHTAKKIQNLIPSAGALANARLVLTNAVYFKGDWTAPFRENRTQEEDFHVSADQSIKSPLMHQTARFAYAEADGLQLLQLPYGDRSLSMLVLLPEKIDGLGELEASLTFDNFQKWTADLKSEQVIVSLPKFKTRAEFQLAGPLTALGMTSAFDPQTADFSKMVGNKELSISAVIHKAFVDVNEKGTEAAAATGVVVRAHAARANPPKPHVFRADHPFVFMIRDNRNESILFLGRIVNPAK